MDNKIKIYTYNYATLTVAEEYVDEIRGVKAIKKRVAGDPSTNNKTIVQWSYSKDEAKKRLRLFVVEEVGRRVERLNKLINAANKVGPDHAAKLNEVSVQRIIYG